MGVTVYAVVIRLTTRCAPTILERIRGTIIIMKFIHKPQLIITTVMIKDHDPVVKDGIANVTHPIAGTFGARTNFMCAGFGNKVGIDPFVQVTPGQLTKASPEPRHLFQHGGTLCGVYGGRGKDGNKNKDYCSIFDNWTPFNLCR